MSEEQNPALEGEIVDNGENSREIGKLNLPAQTLPTTVHILPMTEKPFFPAQTLPLVMNEGPWMETVKQIGESGHHLVGLVAVRGDVSDDARPEDFYSVGTLVRMHHPMHSDGKIQFIAEGVTRFKVAEWVSGKPPFVARVEYPSQPRQNSTSEEVKAYALAIINAIKDLLPLNPLYSEELKFFLNRFSPNEPALLTDFAASLTTAPKEKLQEVIEAFNLRKRMQKVLVLIKKELEVAKLQTQIREKVEEKMTQQQREFFLREQLRAIQKELGIAKDDRTADIDLYRERLEKLTLPAHAQKKIDEEMNKLSGLEHGSPEYTVTRNYLDWLSSLPWGKFTKDKLDLVRARKILDQDHDGLDDVKERIIEFLAVGAMKGEVAGSILLLVGPPGVGKTSIGKSVARALGRQFYRFSVGGMRDEAEIKGHRRTYIGALPGKFIQGHQGSRVAEPGHHARRSRQDRRLVSRRPCLGAAGSARSRAELGLPRPLPGRALRLVEDPVHLHRQPGRYDTQPLAGPHGDDPPVRLPY
jgi:ATP-dependent Lon protease